MMALGRENMDNQNRIAQQGGIQPLIRLLRSPKTTQFVLLTVIKTLGTLCIGMGTIYLAVVESLVYTTVLLEILSID